MDMESQRRESAYGANAVTWRIQHLQVHYDNGLPEAYLRPNDKLNNV